ncbi:MAG: 50S ribosomal protein L24 [Alphaproteobacteria bacterium 41-28]|nr:MAG: 50S ribosomal protein L24 [Alphaproteobacteria bacterium 41-28]
MAQQFRIKKGDRVIVISGKDKGKFGQVLKVLRQDNRLLVQGVNLVKKHQRQTMAQEGGIVQKEASIHMSNVAHVDPVSKKPTRVGIKFLKDGQKTRVAKRSGETIES